MFYNNYQFLCYNEYKYSMVGDYMMKKEEIKRNDLKTDFLKQTIVRLDYDYMFDEYIETTMKNIDSFLGEKGYSIKNSFISQFGLKVDFDKLNNDMNASIMDNINVESDKREKYVSFINEDKHIKIDITREYSAITVDYTEHIHFDEILEIYNKIKEELLNARKNLQIKRLGLRKINIFMMRDLDKINKYFENGIFEFASSNLPSYQFIGKNSFDCYKFNDYKINQIANIAQGYLQDKNDLELLNQLSLDFDVYVENPSENVDLYNMNASLFEIYKNALTETFLNNLLSKEYISEEIFKL